MKGELLNEYICLERMVDCVYEADQLEALPSNAKQAKAVYLLRTSAILWKAAAHIISGEASRIEEIYAEYEALQREGGNAPESPEG